MFLKKIMECFFDNSDYLPAIIKITPEAFSELMGTSKRKIFKDDIGYYIELCGYKIRFVIVTDLPENVEFIIQRKTEE